MATKTFIYRLLFQKSMAVELGEFKSIIENKVFARDIYGEAVSSGGNGQSKKVLIKAVILPRRYTEPTEEQVVAYLQEKVRAIEPSASLVLPDGMREHLEKSELERAILEFPKQIRGHIINGDEDCMTFVRANTSAYVLKSGESPRKYLYVRYGLIPDSIIRESVEHGSMNETDWYDAVFRYEPLIKKGLGGKWRMRVTLKDGGLPDKRDMDVLVRHRTDSSDMLEISIARYDIKQVSAVLDAIYIGLSKPEEIDRLVDVSDAALEESTMEPVVAFQRLILKYMEASGNPRRPTR